MTKIKKINFYLFVYLFAICFSNTIFCTEDKGFLDRVIRLLQNYMAEEKIEGDIGKLLSNNNGDNRLWQTIAKKAKVTGNKEDAQMLGSIVSSKAQGKNELENLERSFRDNEYSLTGLGEKNFQRTYANFTSTRKRIDREKLFPFLKYVDQLMDFSEYEQNAVNKDIAKILGMSDETYNNDDYISADERFVYSWAYRLGGNEGLEFAVNIQRKGKIDPYDCLWKVYYLYSNHYKYISLWWKVYFSDPIVQFEKNILKLANKKG